MHTKWLNTHKHVSFLQPGLKGTQFPVRHTSSSILGNLCSREYLLLTPNIYGTRTHNLTPNGAPNIWVRPLEGAPCLTKHHKHLVFDLLPAFLPACSMLIWLVDTSMTLLVMRGKMRGKRSSRYSASRYAWSRTSSLPTTTVRSQS